VEWIYAAKFAQAQEEWPDLCQYSQGWPVREFLSRYLANHRNYCKKAHGDENDEDENDENENPDNTIVSIFGPLSIGYVNHQCLRSRKNILRRTMPWRMTIL
jgi:hypothetical protein